MKHLCIAMLFVLVAATAANAREAKADLVNFKYKIDPSPEFAALNVMRIRIVGTIINKSATALEASICFRLYDADGFEVRQNTNDKVRLSPGQSNTATGEDHIQQKELASAVLLKAYVSPFGCARSPSEAISQVVEVRMGNTTK